MFSRSERVEQMAKIFSSSRTRAGVSQEKLAAELGVSRKTIQNWEKGISFPDIFQVTEWFHALNINPTMYFLKYINMEEMGEDLSVISEEKLNQAFEKITSQLTIHQKNCILYLLLGEYQGDPYAMLQLFVANAHLPMHYRFSIANNIFETYKMCESAGLIKDINTAMPNLEVLERAIESGREAAINGKDGY